MSLWLYIKAVWKHWWALMSCALFTFLGLYVLEASKSSRWAANATFGVAGFCLLIACFLAWRDCHTEAENLRARIKAIEETKPSLVLREPGAKHIEKIQVHDGKVVFFIGEFVKVRFVNRPASNSPNAVAKDVVAKIRFFDERQNLLLEMDGRWDDKTLPVVRTITSSARDFLIRDFGIEDESNIDIAFFDPRSREIVAFNNDNCNFPQWRKPQHVLKGNSFDVEIRLVAVNVDATFYVSFGLTEDKQHIHLIDKALDNK